MKPVLSSAGEVSMFDRPAARVKSEVFSNQWFCSLEQISVINKPVKVKAFAPNMSKPPYDYTR
jgi:hypothetical protein